MLFLILSWRSFSFSHFTHVSHARLFCLYLTIFSLSLFHSRMDSGNQNLFFFYCGFLFAITKNKIKNSSSYLNGLGKGKTVQVQTLNEQFLLEISILVSICFSPLKKKVRWYLRWNGCPSDADRYSGYFYVQMKKKIVILQGRIFIFFFVIWYAEVLFSFISFTITSKKKK